MPSTAALSDPRSVRLACHAMRCRFEMILEGDEGARLRAAGEEAIEEIRALEQQLSFFDASSELARINREAHDRPIVAEAQLFELLIECRRISELTKGLFDPTVCPAATLASGMRHVELRPRERTVRFRMRGVKINLGAIGKGYALDRAGAILREAGVRQALLHAGTSSVLAIGRPAKEPGWPVAIAAPNGSGRAIARLTLCDNALGVSGNHLQDGHVVDPSTGRPADKVRLAAVVSGSSGPADALSTALLCSGLHASWVSQAVGALAVTLDNRVRTACPHGYAPVFQDLNDAHPSRFLEEKPCEQRPLSH